MSLSSTDLSTLSRLLDEAGELEPLHVEEWLAALPPEHAHLLPRLRDMLAERVSNKHAAFMSDDPKLTDAAADESVAHASDLVGPYRLIREIGRGGMGAVWLAERADGTLKRHVALKLPRLAWGAGLAERMARERDIGALLEHPNIARLYDAGVDALGRPYLALEYIDGQPLDAWCEAKALTVPERLRIFLQVARAVAYAHGRLVVHRDLKPSNVLVTADGQTHLLDFGIAKLLHDAAPGDERLTQEHGRVLTPHYASPEQLRGQPITVASDVYSLGVLLYELLTGRLPYAPERKSLAALEEAVLEGEPALASSRAQDKATAKALRGELDAIVAKALRRDPAQRYATADALAEDIERHLGGERVLARPDSLGYRINKTLRRHRLGFAMAGLLTFTVLGGAAAAVVQARRANDAADRARVVKEFVVDVFRVNGRGDPGNAELRQLPAELLLERGARLIEAKFPGQPRLQAELFGVVGGIFADMGANELAADYATHQVETLVAAHADAAEQARATILLGQALLARERIADARVRAERALELAAGDADLRLQALVLLARVQAAQGRVLEVDRTLGAAERALQGRTEPSVERAWVKYLRALQLAIANRFDEALPAYTSAIDEALRAEGPLSPVAIAIRLSVARALTQHERPDEARPYREAALAALRATGGPADVRAALEESDGNHTLFMMAFQSFSETKTAIERSRTLLVDRGPLVPDSIKAAVDFDLGTTYLIWGDMNHAEALIANSGSMLRSHSESLGRRFQLAAYQGWAAMNAGHHAEAEGYQREGIELRKAMGQADYPTAVFDYVWAATNFRMQGRFDEAQAILDAAPKFQAMQGTPDGGLAYAQAMTRARASIDLERGDPAAALAELPAASSDSESWGWPFDDWLLRGEILCALGRHAEGLALQLASVEVRRAHDYEHHPTLARARATAGLCALAGGNRKRAEALAASARASFIAQPDVSPYFKRPSERLDRLLGAAAMTR